MEKAVAFTYDEAMAYLTQMPKGTALGLYSVGEILKYMGNPERGLRIIHVAGTNGKGSTCAFIAEILQQAGYRVGLYTSPYLEQFNERIRIDRENISDEELAKVLFETKLAVDRHVGAGNKLPTEFEVTTAAAYQYFKERSVDFVVLEVGLGGELDATNTCEPILSVITSVSMDHTDYLGDRFEDIVKAKAGIIKDHVPVVLYHQDELVEKIIREKADKTNSKLVITKPETIKIRKSDLREQTFDAEALGNRYEELVITMTGEHQTRNFLTALTSVLLLEEIGVIEPIAEEDIRAAAKKTKWAGRTELMSDDPPVIIDGAHNPDGAQALKKYIEDYLKDYRIVLVFGMLMDKDIKEVAELLAPLADHIVLTPIDNPRTADILTLKKYVDRAKKNETEVIAQPNIREAVDYAVRFENQENTATIYAGSLYLIGAVRTILKQKLSATDK